MGNLHAHMRDRSTCETDPWAPVEVPSGVIRLNRGHGFLSGRAARGPRASTRVAELFLPRGGESWRNAPRGRLRHRHRRRGERRTLLGAIVARLGRSGVRTAVMSPRSRCALPAPQRISAGRPASRVTSSASASSDRIDLTVTTLRASKRAASLRVAMTQGARAILEALVWVVDDGLNGLAHDEARMPEVPAPDTLRSIEELIAPQDRAQRHRFWENFDVRTDQLGALGTAHAGAAGLAGMVSLSAAHDLRRSLRRCRSFLAAHRYPDVAGGVRSIRPRLRVNRTEPRCERPPHRAAPDAEWLLCDAAAPIAQHGLIGGVARVWSAAGQLLASGGGQLFCRPQPSQ